MKIKVWYHVQDNGDGSAMPLFFATEEEAKASADQELEEFGQALCDNVECEILDVDKYEQVEEDDEK